MSFAEYQLRTLKARLSFALSGFDKDVLERFYSLTPDQLTRLFNIYSASYGDGPAAYARKTYSGWKHGTVRPSAQTINRLLDLSLIHISEPTRLLSISYAVFCLKK